MAELRTFTPSWIPPRLPPRAPATTPAPAPAGAGPPPDGSGPKPDHDRAFYWSEAWRSLRLAHLAREPLCAACLRLGRTRVASLVHHLQARAEAPARGLDPTNLESLCGPCHNKAHPEKGQARK